MIRQAKIFMLIMFTFIVSVSLANSAQLDLNTILMRSTFKIAGSKKLGTAFIIGKPVSGDTQKYYYVLVTAAHVLQDIKEDQAILFLRKKQGEEFIKVPYPLTVRKEGVPL
jgi:hypothetical protein